MTDAMATQRGRSTTSLLGCGCGLLVLGVLAVIVGMTWFTYRQAKGLAEGFTDPERRAASAQEILAYEELPAGYQALGGFSVPFLFKTALLTDKEQVEAAPEGSGESADLFDTRGFVYVETLGMGQRDDQIRAYFESSQDQGQAQEGTGPVNISTGGDTNIDVDFEVREVLGRGTVPVPFGEALYVARAGKLEIEEKKLDGLSTLVYVDCQDDSRVRFGLWFAPLPEPAEAGGAPAGLDGTPADPAAIEEFLGHFQICR